MRRVTTREPYWLCFRHRLVRQFRVVRGTMRFVMDLQPRFDYARKPHKLVAGEGDEPVAYLMAGVIDGCLHVEQVSVHPGSARRGLGRALLEHAASQAVADGLPALTLTTFAQVPWNAPYYARCGFRVLDDAELTPGLRAIRQREADLGLDRWPRVCMRRDI